VLPAHDAATVLRAVAGHLGAIPCHSMAWVAAPAFWGLGEPLWWFWGAVVAVIAPLLPEFLYEIFTCLAWGLVLATACDLIAT
jgi:hypothetical protein